MHEIDQYLIILIFLNSFELALIWAKLELQFRTWFIWYFILQIAAFGIRMNFKQNF